LITEKIEEEDKNSDFSDDDQKNQTKKLKGALNIKQSKKNYL